MRELVCELDIKGHIVTADALHCQKDTCEAIIKASADIFLFVKGNQKVLMKAVAEAVDTVLNGRGYMLPVEKTKSYGGKTSKNFCVRTCVTISDLTHDILNRVTVTVKDELVVILSHKWVEPVAIPLVY